jgi:hypothetical protein
MIMRYLLNTFIRLLLTVVLIPIAIFLGMVFWVDEGFKLIYDIWANPKDISEEWRELKEFFKKDNKT